MMLSVIGCMLWNGIMIDEIERGLKRNGHALMNILDWIDRRNHERP